MNRFYTTFFNNMQLNYGNKLPVFQQIWKLKELNWILFKLMRK